MIKKLIENITVVIPFLSPYPFWVKCLIAIWIILLAIIVISLLFARPKDITIQLNNKSTPTKQEDSRKSKSPGTKNGNEDSLEQNIKKLSTEILNFLADRKRNEPQLPKKDTWHRDTELMIKYSQEIMNQYSIKFAVQVISARNSLFSRGLCDEELDKFYEHPTNAIGIRIVGERLGALSEKLQ